MGRPKSTHCKNGHPWTEANTRTYVDRFGTHRICTICRSDYTNKKLTLKYRNDPAWREAQKAKSRLRYHTVKKSKCRNTSPAQPVERPENAAPVQPIAPDA